MIKKIDATKFCAHGNYKWSYNLQRQWFIIHEVKSDCGPCCNECMNIVYSSEEKAAMDKYEDRLMYCQCCGKLINMYNTDI